MKEEEIKYNEIEDLDYCLELLEKRDKEIEKLKSIIKEVREYMNKHEIEAVYLDCKLYETQAYKDILEILDKGE